MRILSKFHDYLDGCQSLGVDRALIWSRQQRQFDFKGSVFEQTPMALRFMGGPSRRIKGLSLTLFKSCVYFAGRAYPFVVVTPRAHPGYEAVHAELRVQHFYDPVALGEHLKEVHGFSLGEAAYHQYDYQHLGRGEKALVAWFASAAVLTRDIHAHILQNRLTCVLAPWPDEVGRPNQAICLVEPVLADIQFYRALSAAQAYQEMAMFLSGVLPAQSQMPTSISDKDRAYQHGFDRYSFRTPKLKA